MTTNNTHGINFESMSYARDILMNPLKSQADALRILEERNGGTMRIADANNPFGFLLEFGAALNNTAVMRYEEGYRALYPHRAKTMEDLYKHMSDYDYVNMYSKPASTTIELYLNKDYLVNNALDDGPLYKKVIIPRETVFTIGKFKFGLYYPIEIRITRLTGDILVLYDTSETNPLMALTSNMVTSTVMANGIMSTESNFSGLNILAIQFPIYQFTSSYVEENVVSAIGFGKRYKFLHKFYATRVYSIKNDVKTELHQSLSPVIYDYTKPTAKLTVDQDGQMLTIDIPQIYFTNELIGGKIGIEVLTCLGSLDHDLSTIPIDNTAINFNLKNKNISEYSKVLAHTVTLAVRLAQTKVSGGSNGYTFEELRDRVINNNFYGSVPITPSDVEKYFADDGFYVRKTYDGVTDRVFTAFRTLNDDGGSPIPAAMAKVALSSNRIEGISSIIKGDDSSITILPTTLYKYNLEDTSAIPLTDQELSAFKSYDRELLAKTLNETVHTYSPLHLRLDMADRYPTAVGYNLRVPRVNTFVFASENKNIASMMTGFAYDIVHLEEGVGGYDVYMSVTKSSDISTLPEEYLLVYLHTKTREGLTPGIRATFVEVNGPYHIYKVHLTTSYKFDDLHRMRMTNLDIAGFSDHYIDLDQAYYVTFGVSKTAMPSVTQAGFDVIGGLPSELTSEFIGISRQNLYLHLGHRVDDVMRNSIDISYQPVDYMRHPMDVPLTYTHDIYATNEDGTIRADVVDGEVVTYRIHEEGDIVKDDADEVVYLHKTGDVIFDTDGQPIISKEREIIYNTTMLHIDARMIFSEHPDQISLSKSIPHTLEDYFELTREKANQMLEQTRLYFSPTKTLGLTTYNVGDGVTVRNTLNMSFSATYYVPPFVTTNADIQASIREATITAIEAAIGTKIISLTSIFDGIQKQLSDYIYQVDIGGVNGDPLLQSFTIAEESAQPAIGKIMVISNDNLLTLSKNVEITYKSYTAST